MVIERFSQKVLYSGVFNTYIATGFFSTLIFFVINSHLFTPFEMMFGTIIVTVALKGVSNMMLSLIILLFDLEHTKDKYALDMAEDKLDLLVNEIKMKEAKVRTAKSNEAHNKMVKGE